MFIDEEFKMTFVESIILAKGEENLAKFDKKNLTKYMKGTIGEDQLLRRIFNKTWMTGL